MEQFRLVMITGSAPSQY